MRKISITIGTAISLVLAACGGGDGTASSSGVPVAPTVPTMPTAPTTSSGTASISGITGNKLQWQIGTPVTIALNDANGVPVAGTLSCTTNDTAALVVAPNCTSLKAARLGNWTVVVSNGNVNATLQLKVIPQRQPLADASLSGADQGGSSFAALQGDGLVWHWGTNYVAELSQLVGRDTMAQSGLPVIGKQSTGVNFSDAVSHAIGAQFSLAVVESGELWSWGSNSNNMLGRIVPNSNNNDFVPGKVRNPANTGNLTGIVQAGAGDWNAAALSDDGSVYSWGWSNTLGQGPSASGAVPGLVRLASGETLSNVAQISVGRGISLALTRTGTVYAWGRDTDGSTGTGAANIGKTVFYATPVVDGVTLAPVTNIVSISAGYFNSAAVTASGNVYVWGDIGYGTVGQGTTGYGIFLPSFVKAPANSAGNLGNIKSVRVSSGRFMLALDGDGQIYAWGSGFNGTLGQGNNSTSGDDSSLPLLVRDPNGVSTLKGVKAIAASYNNGFALMPNGEVLAWGANFANSLGQNQSFSALNSSRLPLKVKSADGAGTLNIGSLSEFRNLQRQP